MTQQNNSKTHILFVDGLRAVAALYVVLHHCILQTYTPDNMNTLTGLKKIFVAVFMQGHLAVNLFIVISGFSLMLSVIKNDYSFKKGTLDFFKRRAIRILPPYYFSLICSLLLIWLFIGNKTGTHWDISIPVDYKGILTHLFLVQDFFTRSESQINHASWSIAVEWRIYLLFPLLLFVWKKGGPSAALLASIIIAIVAYFMLSFFNSVKPGIDVISAGVNPYIILFSLGMLAADVAYSNRLRYTKILNFPWLLLLIVSAVLLSAYRFYKATVADATPNLTHRISDVLFGLCCFCLIVACARAGNKKNISFWLSKALAFQPLVFIGTFSYSLYLIHPPLIQLISQYILFPLHLTTFTSTWLMASFGCALIVGSAYLFFICCERPFINMLKRRKDSIAMFEATVSPAP